MHPKYIHWEVGERLRNKRLLLSFTQEEVSEKINRSPKYYADIERGDCGMSIDTLISLSIVLDLSTDYILFGKVTSIAESVQNTDEEIAAISLLNKTTNRKRNYALRMLKLFLAACGPDVEQK